VERERNGPRARLPTKPGVSLKDLIDLTVTIADSAAPHPGVDLGFIRLGLEIDRAIGSDLTRKAEPSRNGLRRDALRQGALRQGAHALRPRATLI
jgi:hypothetical protein